MPVLSRGGAMSIVAHQDDDILFMNPDIARSIAQGEANTTVFVTAGDAGLGEDYWLGREEGAKAAYSVMTGHDEWVDETITIDTAGQSIDVYSSYLLEAPEIRLYFLRLPDGGGALEPGTEQQLARLEGGQLAEVSTIDGEAVYSRSDVVEVLTGLMDLHAPSAFRLQVHDGETAGAEHTDHTHTAEFSEEALDAYSGGTVQVTHYVHYDSRLMPANLSPEDAAFSLEVMLAYAAFDPAVLGGDGSLAEIYETWTARQYIAESYSLDTSADEGGSEPIVDPDAAWPGDGDWIFSLEGPDAFLFRINAVDGSVEPEDWFVPSATDAWDQNEDHVYEVSRIATPVGAGEAQSQDLLFETTAEGVLTLVSTSDGPEVVSPPIDDGTDTMTGGDGQDTVPAEDVPGTGGEDTVPADVRDDVPVEPDLSPGTVYSLDGDDAFLFQIDDQTGAITPQAWFVPDMDDAWDSDENHIYELTRVATPADGGPANVEQVRLQTVGEGDFAVLSGATDADSGDAIENPADPPPEDTGTDGSIDDGGATVEDSEDPAADDTLYGYVLSGPDAQVFVIDPLTGDIALQSWFAPEPGDAWDQNEDNIYEVARTAIASDGSTIGTEDLRLEIGSDGALVSVESGAALLAALSQPTTEADAFLLEEAEELASEMDALV